MTELPKRKPANGRMSWHGQLDGPAIGCSDIPLMLRVYHALIAQLANSDAARFGEAPPLLRSTRPRSQQK